MTSLAIVSGGLREPSSTRLLADRLAALGAPGTWTAHGLSVDLARWSSCGRSAGRSWTRC